MSGVILTASFLPLPTHSSPHILILLLVFQMFILEKNENGSTFFSFSKLITKRDKEEKKADC